MVGKQGELLKKVNESDFFIMWGRSNICLKTRLLRFLTKFPVLKSSSISLSYVKSNLNVIKMVGKESIGLFGKKIIMNFANIIVSRFLSC